MINRGSEWHRWEPHIHGPGTIMNNQYGAPSVWADYLSALEAARLPEPLRTTDAQTGGGSAESEASTDALPAFLADAEDGGPEDPTDAEEHLTRSRRNDS